MINGPNYLEIIGLTIACGIGLYFGQKVYNFVLSYRPKTTTAFDDEVKQ